MNTTKTTRAVAMLALIGATSACDTGLTEVNENPNNP